ncbi:MAG: caspase family protein [Caldisericaceae bacterium]|nr:caspase family protein [Caldisericaceae bacterium]
MYIPGYKNSWALIIGINSYPKFPLSYARNDAEAIHKLLVDNFNFPKENISLLIDEAATRTAIIESFLRFTQEDIDPNDRIFVFFAGHGYTHAGKRGEVGYLVPVDGSPDKLASMIRWDELTRNADLIQAKHMLFVMDACYGGLAITRSPGPGSMRFLKSMLQRFSRQVITAGKADEVVADSGGPIPEHSVFTGHLLQGLKGKAATPDGIICANGLMAYVYEKVAKDSNSRQTPHFGFIDGDGDFIFTAPMLESLVDETEEDKDILIEIPPAISTSVSEQNKKSIIEIVKEYIPDSRFRTKLDDLVTREIRRILFETSDEKFPAQADVSPEEFTRRLTLYEAIVKDIQSIVILLSHWGDEEHIPVLRKIIARIVDNKTTSGGKVVWLALRYYPCLLLLYSGGIAAIAAGKYDNLHTIMYTMVGSKYSGEKNEEIIKVVVREALELERTNIFKSLPGYERYYVPKSEYLFKALQSVIDDLLFLGNSYESSFDRFEVFMALVYADMDKRLSGHLWGPPGRFAYKHRNRGGRDGPFYEVISEAKSQGENWPPLKAGFFNGSYERFQEITNECETLIGRLNWF